MSNADPPPNVKIYDRPEPKTPKALFLVIAVIVLLAIGLLIYKFVLHPATPAALPLPDCMQPTTVATSCGTLPFA